MARKSKFFRVAVEGATTDGRKIERKTLLEMAKNYNRETYGARIFMEHIRGVNPDYGFKAFGDVLSLKTDTITLAGESKLALFAEIEPTDDMVAMVKARQKIYSSIEINPDFAGTGEAYLQGLGITDSPASLGTEILTFASQNPDANIFTARKHSPDNLFSAAEESEIEFLEEDAVDPAPTLLARIQGMFKRRGENDDSRFADVHAAVEHVATATSGATEGLAALRAENQTQIAAFRAEIAAIRAASEQAIADLTNTLNHTPSGTPRRPAATGGTGAVATDC